MFTLVISIALFCGPNIPGSYVILLFIASNLASITSPIHNWVVFLLWLHPFILLELFLHWSPVAYWAPTDLGSSSFSVLSFCLFILFMGFSRQEYWSGLPFPSPGTTFCQTSPPWPDSLRWPHTAWLSFTEWDTAVVLWSDWLVFCDYGFSVSAVWCPLSVPTVLLGFLLPWTWGLSSRLLHQSAAAAPYLGRGVAPLGRCPWPPAWGSSSQPRLWSEMVKESSVSQQTNRKKKEQSSHRSRRIVTTRRSVSKGMDLQQHLMKQRNHGKIELR